MKTCIVVLYIFLTLPLFAADLKCELYQVVDGDTFKCNLEGIPEIFGKELSIRIKDCDSPEIRTKDLEEKKRGYLAKAELEQKLNGKDILLKNIERGKYFRLVADVYADGQQVRCPYDKTAKIISVIQLTSAATYKCGTKTKCSQMASCDEAYFFLKNCGLSKLDKDKDGVPCESICR